MKFHLCTFVATLAGLGITLTNSPAGETWEGTLGKSAALVLGQEDFVSADANRGGVPSDKTMSAPNDVAIDPTTGKVFVCDGANHRVLRFASTEALTDGVAAEAVLGQADAESVAPATSRSRMRLPAAIAVDSDGRLWVSDSLNHRVLRFDNAAEKDTGANADGVLGQTNFTNNSSARSQTGMNLPLGLAIDSAGRLWVVDSFNSRVLRFDDAANKDDGDPANALIGQLDFDQFDPSGFINPSGIAIDAEGGLWLADTDNHRVFLYENAATLNGVPPFDLLLGQIDVRATSPGISATRFDSPRGLAIDAQGNLWVSDSDNHRILRFENATGLVLGIGADGVLGQEDFASKTASTKRGKLQAPFGIATDGQGNLWVADQQNNRVLRFEPDRFQPDGQVGARAAALVGDDRYSGEGAAQVVRVRMKGRKRGQVFFRIENDGNLRDEYFGRASRGNRKLKVIYLAGGRNITGQLVRGAPLGDFTPGEIADFQARIKATRKSRGRRAGRTLMLDIRSETDGERDVVIAKVKKKP